MRVITELSNEMLLAICYPLTDTDLLALCPVLDGHDRNDKVKVNELSS
jgi:hypothetical protein